MASLDQDAENAASSRRRPRTAVDDLNFGAVASMLKASPGGRPSTSPQPIVSAGAAERASPEHRADAAGTTGKSAPAQPLPDAAVGTAQAAQYTERQAAAPPASAPEPVLPALLQGELSVTPVTLRPRWECSAHLSSGR